MTPLDNRRVDRACFITRTAIKLSLTTAIMFFSVAAAEPADQDFLSQALGIASIVPGQNKEAITKKSDIAETAEAAMASVRGVVGLMRQAQEVSSMLPGNHSALPSQKTGLGIALRAASRVPDYPAAAASIAKPQGQSRAVTTPKPNIKDSRGQNLTLPGDKNLIWPVDGLIYSAFNATRGKKRHGAVDIVTKKGTPIAAAADGVVSVATNGGRSFRGYGKLIILDHGRDLYTVYAHCDSIIVKMGQRIKQGEYIGTVGRTGRASTDHVHFEVRIAGKKHDPLAYLPSRHDVVKSTNYHSPKKKTK